MLVVRFFPQGAGASPLSVSASVSPTACFWLASFSGPFLVACLSGQLSLFLLCGSFSLSGGLGMTSFSSAFIFSFQFQWFHLSRIIWRCGHVQSRHVKILLNNLQRWEIIFQGILSDQCIQIFAGLQHSHIAQLYRSVISHPCADKAEDLGVVKFSDTTPSHPLWEHSASVLVQAQLESRQWRFRLWWQSVTLHRTQCIRYQFIMSVAVMCTTACTETSQN